MQIDRMTLENFRNYQCFSQAFSPGVNLILGENAQGKTNLLEAIYALSTGHGFAPEKRRSWCALGRILPICKLRSPAKSANKPFVWCFFPAAGQNSCI